MTDGEDEPPFWHAPWRIAVEAITGTLIFLIIAAFAILLDIGVSFLEARNINSIIIWGLIGAKYTLFAVDLILFGRFLWKTLLRNWEKL